MRLEISNVTFVILFVFSIFLIIFGSLSYPQIKDGCDFDWDGAETIDEVGNIIITSSLASD